VFEYSNFLAYSVARLFVIERWFHFPTNLFNATVLPWEMSKARNGKFCLKLHI